ncbi:MAG: hypothetical protein ACE147_16820, partial [Candidatus Methylomirabilales bacterium]
MKKLIAYLAVVLMVMASVAPAFAQQAAKGTEGPDIRKQEAKGTEGPDIRKQEPKGTEGPDVRKAKKKTAAAAVQKPKG